MPQFDTIAPLSLKYNDSLAPAFGSRKSRKAARRAAAKYNLAVEAGENGEKRYENEQKSTCLCTNYSKIARFFTFF
ncbi:hypothetical protein [Rhodoblastus sp.]|uniref:hypothetical protein n=1 Tax=Rhodoblastus sp. TaxID=1962975 RepID=UPI003F978554